jgi:hypothetical protein
VNERVEFELNNVAQCRFCVGVNAEVRVATVLKVQYIGKYFTLFYYRADCTCLVHELVSVSVIFEDSENDKAMIRVKHSPRA